MGSKKISGKLKVSSSHAIKIISLVRKILRKTQTERLKFFLKINENDLNLIVEIIINFLHGNIPYDITSLKLLKRVKKWIYILSSMKTSRSMKRNILSSLKGLQICKIIFPLLMKVLS